MLLAVSGGPDSSALMHAAAAVGPAAALHVATVDHGLRAGSAAEAAAVGRAADGLGLPHAILPWPGEKPSAGLQAAARAARYALLEARARSVGADLVLTGHTLDDQAETVLLRLAAGSGPAGLAGMQAERPFGPGIRIGRPFLGLPKAVLAAWCAERCIPHVRDPANADPRFARARLRAAWPILAAEGLTPARLARLARRVARDEAALGAAAVAALAAAGRPGPSGRLRLDGAALAALPEAVALRCLDLALAQAGAGPRRLGRLEALLDALLPALRAGQPIRRTLADLVIAADAARNVTLTPAPRRRIPKDEIDDCAALAAGAGALLGKGRAPAYIGEACAGEPATPSEGSVRGPHAPGIDR